MLMPSISVLVIATPFGGFIPSRYWKNLIFTWTFTHRETKELEINEYNLVSMIFNLHTLESLRRGLETIALGPCGDFRNASDIFRALFIAFCSHNELSVTVGCVFVTFNSLPNLLINGFNEYWNKRVLWNIHAENRCTNYNCLATFCCKVAKLSKVWKLHG